MGLSTNVADPDLWGHVTYGRDTRELGLATTSTYTYAAPGFRWINHENLSEYLMSWLADAGGAPALQWFKVGLGIALIGLIAGNAAHERVSWLATTLTCLLVTLGLAHHWHLRPQLLTYFLFAVMLSVLQFCFPMGQRSCGSPSFSRLRGLMLLPVIMLVWANAHGGFVAGLAILLLYLGIRAGELWVREGRQAKSRLLLIAIVAIGSLAATLMNPYGIELHRWLLQSLGAARPEITEWHPPAWMAVDTWPFWIGLAIAAVAVVRGWRRLDLAHCAVLAVCGWQALEHQRHVPFFVIACGFWLPRELDRMLVRFTGGGSSQAEDTLWGRRIVTATSVGLILFLAGGLILRNREIRVQRDRYPVSALEFIAKHELQGRMVVTYNWAQYVIAAFGERSKTTGGIEVGFDGRFRTCYPQAVLDQHFDFILGNANPELRNRSPRSPAPDGSRVLELGQPNLVLINRSQQPSVQTMQRERERWVLLYQDRLAQLWGRSDQYDNPRHPAFLPPEVREIGDQLQHGFVAWPALPASRPRPAEDLVLWENREE